MFPTRPWEEGVTDDGSFELYAETLISHTRFHEPLWIKAVYFCYGIGMGMKAVVTGVYNAGMHLVFNFFEEIKQDWYSSLEIPSWDVLRAELEEEIKAIALLEEKKLNDVFEEAKHEKIKDLPASSLGTLAQVEYHLNAGEYNDICNAGAQAFGGFIEHFTHGLFAKDPVGGLSFTFSGVLAMACIASPVIGKTLLGSSAHTLESLAKLVGSSPSSKVLGGSFMVAQVPPLVLNMLTDGPSSTVVHVGKKFMDNPIPTSIGFLAAYGLGYVLANLPVPYMHELIKNELGSSDILNYPVLGFKFGIMSVYLVYSDEANGYTSVEIPYVKIDNMVTRMISDAYQNDPGTAAEYHKLHEHYQMQRWLNTNASMLTKLKSKSKFDTSRKIDKLFERDEALSLQKLITPEEERSIGYQFFAVTLGYIPAVLRPVIAMGSSIVAFICENPHWLEPIKQSGLTLLRKMAKDINRLNVAAGRLLRAIVSFVASNPMALFSVFNMLIERVAAFGNHYRPGHDMYKNIAYPVHALYSSIGEFLFPVRAMKSVVSADPSATVHAMLGSYEGLMKKLGVNLNEQIKEWHVDRCGTNKEIKIIEPVIKNNKLYPPINSSSPDIFDNSQHFVAGENPYNHVITLSLARDKNEVNSCAK